MVTGVCQSVSSFPPSRRRKDNLRSRCVDADPSHVRVFAVHVVRDDGELYEVSANRLSMNTSRLDLSTQNDKASGIELTLRPDCRGCPSAT